MKYKNLLRKLVNYREYGGIDQPVIPNKFNINSTLMPYKVYPMPPILNNLGPDTPVNIPIQELINIFRQRLPYKPILI
jgi:DNA polymerase III sliding clamp (beta) subunit (PCNA family)